MKCPICGKDLELKNKQIGTTEDGEPIFNEYAICRDCKKQWNLDKQRAKKQAAKKAASAKTDKPSVPEDGKTSVKTPPEKKAVSEKAPEKKPKHDDSLGDTKATPVRKKVPVKKKSQEQPAVEKDQAPSHAVPAKKPVKKRAVQKQEPDETNKRYSNIPSEKVRTKREKAVRQGYEDMLSTGKIDRPQSKKKKKQEDDTKSLAVNSSKKTPEPVNDYEDDYYDDAPRFRVMRILLGIVSLIGFGYFIYRGFNAGLASISDDTVDSGMIFVILALCMLVSALLYFIMQKSNTIFAFLLPMVFYLGSGVFAFLRRGDDLQLLIAAMACIVLAIISLILAITSRGGDDYEDEDDDAFDDYDDDYDE